MTKDMMLYLEISARREVFFAPHVVLNLIAEVRRLREEVEEWKTRAGKVATMSPPVTVEHEIKITLMSDGSINIPIDPPWHPWCKKHNKEFCVSLRDAPGEPVNVGELSPENAIELIHKRYAELVAAREKHAIEWLEKNWKQGAGKVLPDVVIGEK